MALSYTEHDKGFRATEANKVFWALKPDSSHRTPCWHARVYVVEPSAEAPENTVLRQTTGRHDFTSEAQAKAWLETQR